MNKQSHRVTLPPNPLYYLDGNNNLTIHDFSPQNALIFSQGDWPLIRRDLEYAGFASDELDRLWCLLEADHEQNYCQDIVHAFHVRKELIHYKKLILHLFHEAKKLERQLQQYCSFFYWYDGDDLSHGIKVHYEVLGESLDLMLGLSSDSLTGVGNDCDTMDNLLALFTQLPNSMQLEESAMRHRDPSSCSFIDRKRLFVTACAQRMFVKGLLNALQDARDINKAICLSPRHPDGVDSLGALRKRITTQLPQSLFSYRTFIASTKEQEWIQPPPLEEDFSQLHLDNKKDQDISNDFSKCGHNCLSKTLQRVQDELDWSPEAIEFLKKSILARGGFKALAMMDELQMCIAAMEPFLGRLKELLLSTIRTEVLSRKNVKLQQGGPNEMDLSLSIQRHKSIALLSGMILAVTENMKWMQVLADKDNDRVTSRLFVACDQVSALHACAFVPKDFQLGSFLQRPRHIIDCVLRPAMDAALCTEEWPPHEGSRRTRALAYRACDIAHMSVDVSKLQRCKRCCGYFDTRWVHHNFCSVCEMREKERIFKESSHTKCFFGQCRVDAFCPHSQRCFVCDAPHSCENFCRLSMGDGELVAEWMEQLKPHYLLIDFDRTLCSTKRGASPLSKQSSVAHTIDADLKDILINQQLYGEAFIVTRNSHKADIEEFLRISGLVHLSNNVHVVPKKRTKGSYIKQTFYYSDQCLSNKICLYLDDDIRELVGDPFLKEDKRIHRVLFVRGTK